MFVLQSLEDLTENLENDDFAERIDRKAEEKHYYQTTPLIDIVQRRMKRRLDKDS